MNFSDLPKIELHLHLDCSLSFGVVKKLRPKITKAEYQEFFTAPAKCRDLADYIRRSLPAIELMQTEQALKLVTEDLFEQLLADNVLYAEIRFAPLEHTKGNLTTEEVVQVVNDTVEEQVEKTGIEAGILLCTLRHYSEKQSMQTVKLVEQFEGSWVVGFDIAADEAAYSVDNHIKAFEYADERNLNCTAHAGEACGPESVWETLNKFSPSRIGHGVRSYEDPKLVEYLKKENIHLEVCPTSNVQTDVFETITDHSVKKLFESGVSLSINTDTRTISNVTLNDEYETVASVFGWTTEELLQSNLHALDHAFTDDGTKASLRKQLTKAYW